MNKIKKQHILNSIINPYFVFQFEISETIVMFFHQNLLLISVANQTNGNILSIHKMRFKNQQQIESKNREQKLSLFQRFIKNICPCLGKPQTKHKYQKHEETKTQIDKERSSKEVLMLEPPKNQIISIDETKKTPGRERKPHIFSSLQEKNMNNFEFNNMRNSVITKWTYYPVSMLKQKEIILVGKQKSKLLCKLTAVCLEPSEQAKKLTKRSKISEKTEKSHGHGQLYLDKYWDRRYSLFQKFDEGISINDNCWPTIIPQAVSDYIASKIRCETVLNMQCGVGGQAIKLANTCGKVIATDREQKNLKCLQINSKIYCAQNIKALTQPQQLRKQLQPQIILISLYTKLQQQCLNNPTTPLTQIKPNIISIIKKALNITTNLVLILPANIDISQVNSTIAQHIIENNIHSQSCFIQIQKIFYKAQLKYVVVYYGVLLQTEVTIDDQLQFIYNKLGFQSKISLGNKKVVKKLRENLGMVKLLNIILDLQSTKDKLTLQSLQSYILSKNLISKQSVEKIFSQLHKSDGSSSKQNKQQNTGQYGDRTISSISIGTIILNRQSFQNKLNDGQNDPYLSAPLNRQSMSINLKPQSIISFGLPSPVNEQEESRESFVVGYNNQDRKQ